MKKIKETYQINEEAKSLDIDSYINNLTDNDGIAYLNDLLASKNMTIANVAKNAEIDYSYATKIFGGKRRKMSRDYMIAIGIGMELNLEEVNYLLRRNGIGELSGNNTRRDGVIIYGIVNAMTMKELNETLESKDLEPIILSCK